MKKIFRLSIFTLGIPFLFIYMNSCVTSSTVITGTWEKPEVEKNYQNIIVEPLVSSLTLKSTIEQEMIESLKAKGVNPSKSEDIFLAGAVEENDEKQEILDSIKTNGTEGILTISLIEKESESRYVPGSSPYAPYPRFPYYGSFWGYYNYWYPHVYRPGYYSLENVYYIETNLFDAESEELIWSAQSKTYEQSNLKSFSKDYAKEIVNKLEEDGLI